MKLGELKRDDGTRTMLFECPGCEMSHMVNVAGSGRPMWTWNGSMERPTFSPSVLVNWWQVTTPDGSGCTLNPAIHAVTEHEDGTITAHPSIVTSTWHGWLEGGVWRSV